MRSPLSFKTTTTGLLLLACLTLFASLTTLTSAQPPAGFNYTTYHGMIQLLRAKPFDPALRDSILASLNITMSIYTFHDLNLDSTIGAPYGLPIYPQKHDIDAALRTVATTKYASDYDMNDAFAQVFIQLNDAHTAYHKPYPTQAFALPLRLQSMVTRDQTTTQRIFISTAPIGDALYSSVYGYTPLANVTNMQTGQPVTLSSINGFEVVGVNGFPSVQYFWELAGLNSTFQTGISKEQHTRFNLLVHGFSSSPNGPPGYFAYRAQRSFGIPIEEFTTFQIRDVNVPDTVYNIVYQWIGMYQSASDEFVAKTYGSPKQYKNAILSEQSMREFYWSIHSQEHPAVKAQQLAGQAPTATPQPQQPQPAASSAASVDVAAFVTESMKTKTAATTCGDQICFGVLADGTGVLQIINFEPDSNTDFLNFLQQSITTHQQNNGTRLIIDLRSNGGGDICLGYSVIRFLFPSILQPDFAFDAADSPFGHYDMSVAPFTQLLADLGEQSMLSAPVASCANGNGNFFTPCSWLNPATQTMYANESWFDSGRILNRGGRSRQYTALFHDSCSSYFAGLAPSDMNPGYEPKNTVLVTDGMCGSTCSVFSSYIIYHQLAKSVALGGYFNDALVGLVGMQAWSFPGGQVSNIDELQQIVVGYNIPLNDSRVPQAYTNGATQTFTIREIYPWDDTIGAYPLEFVRHIADFHLPYRSNFTDAATIYSSLVNDFQLFGDAVCVSGITDLSCSTPNGVGAYRCVNGVIDYTACLAVSCDDGYFAFMNNDQCTACPMGTYRIAANDPTLQRCTDCELVTEVSVPADGSLYCVTYFSAEGWPNATCPYYVSCGPSMTPGGSSDAGYLSKGTTILICLLFSAVILILLIMIVILYQRQLTSTTNTIFHSAQPLDSEASEVNFSRI